MEPLYKNIANTTKYSIEITRKNSKKQEFEAAYLKEINVNIQKSINHFILIQIKYNKCNLVFKWN